MVLLEGLCLISSIPEWVREFCDIRSGWLVGSWLFASNMKVVVLGVSPLVALFPLLFDGRSCAMAFASGHRWLSPASMLVLDPAALPGRGLNTTSCVMCALALSRLDEWTVFLVSVPFLVL